MDPHFGVLLRDENQGECDSEVGNEKSKKDKLIPVYIVVPVVGVVLLIAAIVVLKPR